MNKPEISFYEIDYEADKKGFVSLPHAHRHYEIFYFERGEADHYIDFTKHPIADHSVFLVSYNQLHYIEVQPFSHNTGSVLSFDRAYFDLLENDFRHLFGAFERDSSYYLGADTGTLVRWNMAQIKQEMAGHQPKSESAILSYVNLILTTVFRNKKAGSEVVSPSKAIAQRLLSELETSFRQERTASGYADLLSISTRQLNRICQAEFGTNLLRIIHQRINLEAKRLLVFTNSPIKEVGYEVGFEDQAHFSNFFKKMNGDSPENFRKAMSDIYN